MYKTVRQCLARHEESLHGILFVLPTIVLLLIFSMIPVIYTFYMSLHYWDILSLERFFLGWDNYRAVLNDPLFWKVARNTLYYTIGTVPTTMALALGVALLFDRKIRGSHIYRTFFFAPTITSTVAISIVWLWLYDPSYGPINYFLRIVGITGPNWLGDPRWAMPAVIIMSVWKDLGYAAVIFFAGLQNVPHELYEAAKIDGAGAIDRFRYVTWPSLLPTTFFLLITSIISSFQVFDRVFILTNGGPINSTNVVVFYLYNKAFRLFEMGYGASVAYLLFGVILLVTIIQWRLMDRYAY